MSFGIHYHASLSLNSNDEWKYFVAVKLHKLHNDSHLWKKQTQESTEEEEKDIGDLHNEAHSL